MLNLSDKEGRLRIRKMVDALGHASLEFLEESGRVTHSLPAGARR